jgi:GR25 family glycosyltransferase involved in LPS biosynthesis
MNFSKSLRGPVRSLFSLFLKCRRWLPRRQCLAFSTPFDSRRLGIGPIFVINLDRQPDRWADVCRELGYIVDAAGKPLSERVIRYSACDALVDTVDSSDIDPFYKLRDQLFVEPQPHAIPDEFDLERSIRMSNAEVAVACSHMGIWKTIANSEATYSLVLEDDVWFERGFSRLVDLAWREMEAAGPANPIFDVLYLSYKEVRHGAPKKLTSKSVFRPERGLWQLSGYVLSKKGAQILLQLLPCRGPVDLWINHKFQTIDVRALRRSVINQRPDVDSTNSYSILPALSQIGVLEDGDASLFQGRPIHTPVFGIGQPGSSELSSLAMALSMLGYRCCSDFDRIPRREFGRLLSGRDDRVFDAYVNIGTLKPNVRVLKQVYPLAKFIVFDDATTATDDLCDNALNELEGADVLRLHGGNSKSWRALCGHVRLAPPDAPYPDVPNIGQRKYQCAPIDTFTGRRAKWLRRDRSPWVVHPRVSWVGIGVSSCDWASSASSRVRFEDDLGCILINGRQIT